MEEKRKLEEEKKKLKEIKQKDRFEIERKDSIKYNNGKTKTFLSQERNNSHFRYEQFSNFMNFRYDKFLEENNLNGLNERTIKDSEILGQEVISINDLDNNDIITIEKKNNYMGQKLNEKDINNYRKIKDKEISYKINNELKENLFNKKRKYYNFAIMNELKNNRKTKNSIFLELKSKSNRNKKEILDLEAHKKNRIKNIEQILKDGIDKKTLKVLESYYKYNNEINEIINEYKMQKLMLEKEEINKENLFDLMRKDKVYIKSINKLNNNKIYINTINKKIYYQNNRSIDNLNIYNKCLSLNMEYPDLYPFYDLTNGIKLSEHNDEKRNNKIICLNNFMSKEQTIQNKLNMFKKKAYKPFLNKIEKEKIKEKKRIQLINSIKDSNIKSILEAQFGIMRGKIDYELKKEKEKINREIKNYEVQLMLNENESQKEKEQKNIFFD